MASSYPSSTSSRSTRSNAKHGKDSSEAVTTNAESKRERKSENVWDGWRDYINTKKQKVDDQFNCDSRNVKQSSIFDGVRIYINGYTKPSSDELRRLMQIHGGKTEMYLSKRRVTHIVATNLPNSKLHQAKTIPVIRPDWITDSVTAGKRLPHVDYLLFDNRSKHQPGLKFGPSATSLTANNGSSSTISSDLGKTVSAGIKDDASLLKKNNVKYNDGDGEAERGIIGSVENTHEGQLKGMPNLLEQSQYRIGFNGGFQSNTSNSNMIGNHQERESNEDLKISFIAEKETSQYTHDASTRHSWEKTFQEKDTGNEKEQHIDVHSSDEMNELIYDSEEEGKFPRKLNLTKVHVQSKRTSNTNTKVSFSSESESIVVNTSNQQCADEERQKKDGNFDKRSDKLFEFESSHSNGKLPHESLIESKTTMSTHQVPSPQHQHPNPLSSSSSSHPMARAGDKNFLSEYYSNSRLHHLSSWGEELKAYVMEIQKSKIHSFSGREKLRQAHVENVSLLGVADAMDTERPCVPERTIMHIDMDCFFVSVGLLSRQDLRGKPVCVTHSRGQGLKPHTESDAAWEKAEWHKKRDGKLKTQTDSMVDRQSDLSYDHLVPPGSTGVQTFQSMAAIAACSYEARQKGVKNGMFMGRARMLCPDLQAMPYDFAEYNRISRILYASVASYTHDIEAVSCDEMLVDCTDLLADTGATALEFASLLRLELMEKTGCPASAGIGPNILLAKLSTRKAKPNGQFQVLSCDAKHFIKDQDISNVPGVGYSMTRKLAKLHVKTCGDLQSVPVSRLRAEFGPKTGESLHQYSLGQDDREVKSDKQRKSVSAEVNYGIRFKKESDAYTFLRELSTEVQQRLAKLKLKGHSITLKLMVRRPDAPQETAKFMGHGICNTINKTITLPVSTNDGVLITREVIAMYKSQNTLAADVRGIGIQVQKLESETAKDYGAGKQLTGHQSILNFAVAGKDISETQTMSPFKLVVKDGAASSTPSAMADAKGDNFSSDRLDLNSMSDVSFLLSPSQVNTDVLKELPEDIAKEIQAGIEQHQRTNRRPQEIGSTSVPGPSRSGCSSERTQSMGNRHDGPGRRLSNEDPPPIDGWQCDNTISDLPAMSQVNLACFQSLPPDVQMELQAAYAKQRMHSHQSEERRAILVGTALGELTSPVKSKKGKQSRTGKRRGRPPGKKKLMFPDQHVKVIRAPMEHRVSIERNKSVDSDVVVILDDEVEQVENISGKEHPFVSCQDLDHGECSTARNAWIDAAAAVSFCGAESVYDVRRLLKDWLNSNTDPREDDVAMVMDYLISLIKAKLLEQAYCHLRFLTRCSKSLPPDLSSWRQSLENIVNQVQSCVCDLYEADFKLL